MPVGDILTVGINLRKGEGRLSVSGAGAQANGGKQRGETKGTHLFLFHVLPRSAV